MVDLTNKPLTAQEVADYLKCSTTEVYALCKAGKLQHFRIGKSSKSIRVSEQHLSDYLESVEQASPPIIPMPPKRPSAAPRSGGYAALRAIGWKG